MIRDSKRIEILKNWKGSLSELKIYDFLTHKCNCELMLHNEAWQGFPTQIADDLGLNHRRCSDDIKALIKAGYIKTENGTIFSKGKNSLKFFILNDVIYTKDKKSSDTQSLNLDNEESSDTVSPNNDHNKVTQSNKSSDTPVQIKLQGVTPQKIHLKETPKDVFLKEATPSEGVRVALRQMRNGENFDAARDYIESALRNNPYLFKGQERDGILVEFERLKRTGGDGLPF